MKIDPHKRQVNQLQPISESSIHGHDLFLIHLNFSNNTCYKFWVFLIKRDRKITFAHNIFLKIQSNLKTKHKYNMTICHHRSGRGVKNVNLKNQMLH